ncbi:MAG: GlmU family protein, partial [Bacteroidia bacterium]|nr:GlmU family protein [Bacteroidia bacterium]
MNIILFDEVSTWQNLLPLTYTRPVSGIRIGILTIYEKWKHYFPGAEITCLTEKYLSEKYPLKIEEVNYFINASVLPSPELVKQIAGISNGEEISTNELLIAYKGSLEDFNSSNRNGKKSTFTGDLLSIKNVYDIFLKNGKAISDDFSLITGGRRSEQVSSSVKIIGNTREVFIEKGAVAEACIFNTKNGPIYIGKDAEVMEGTVIRGPFALCEHSATKMAAKIYGPTTVGPHSKVGGEINNSVIFGFSNKAHDGFLGNSVVGEWCNLGADTNNSNLKNNYGNVKLFNYRENTMLDTGLQFCGLIMGDHSKSGINTMFNTGTVVGVGANVFGGSFPSKHIPSFSWGGENGFETYKIEKMLETAEMMYERRGLKLEAID